MLTDFEKSIISPNLRIVAAHWLAARRGREMPAWAGLMPSAIKAQLHIVWSYNYDAATDTFTGRLAGEGVATIFGKNFHGLPMSEVRPKANYPSLFAQCKRILTEPALFHGVGMTFGHRDKSCAGERIIMPLSADGLVGDGLFGATDIPSFDHERSEEISFEREEQRWFRTMGEKAKA